MYYCVGLNCHGCGRNLRGAEVSAIIEHGGPQLCFGCFAMRKLRRYRFVGWTPWRKG